VVNPAGIVVSRPMIPPARRFFNPSGPDRVAEVAVEPAADREAYIISVMRGPSTADLRQVAVHGPYLEDGLAAPFAQAVEDLRGEGFWPGGMLTLLEALDNPAPAVRARAAVRLGWRRTPEAVEKLLALLPGSVDETCSLLDALGAIGDPRAVPLVRDYAARKLLSRRRSAVEALRQLGDTEGMDQARQRARERLHESVLLALDAAESSPAPDAAATLAQAVLSLEPQQQGLAIDTLYELAGPVSVATVRQVLGTTGFAQAFVWRGVKSVLKRALLRHDYTTFGQVVHMVERQGRSSKGTAALVKSGLDGKQRNTPIFSRKTQDFLRRQAWRYLRDLALHRPLAFPYAAAEAIVPYTPEDVQKAGLGRCYLLHRILFNESKRFHFEGRRMTYRPRRGKAPVVALGFREEAFPDLWDAQPRAFLRVLTAARVAEAHPFALRALTADHPQVIQAASHAEIVALLHAPYEPTVQLGLRELERRFDPDHPDWQLLLELLADERPTARTLGQRWLRLTAHLWLREPELILAFAALPNANLRALVVELAAAALATHPEVRQALARRTAELLRLPEITPGAHEGYAYLAREMLAADLASLIGVAELVEWITRGAPAVKSLAGHLLRLHPEAVTELGLERLTRLAEHEVASVRAAAHVLIRSAVPQLRADPSLLFVLVESEWEDTHRLAFDLLRTGIDLEALGLDGLTGLLDSNRPDVQEVGRELAVRHTALLPMGELAARLAQHPDPGMRRFALDLVTKHLPAGGAALAPLRGFCRAALLDLRPDRLVKRQMIDFLTARGLEDEQQAGVAAAVLGDMVRLQGRADFENALEALVRLKLAYPDLKTTVRLPAGGGP
jgi:hypothetical protein